MMQYIGEWITHIILIILIASFVDLLLPNSTMKRYVKLVVGLLIIMFILSPILDLFRFDYERLLSSVDELLQEETESSDPQVEAELKEIERMQEEAILAEVSERWKGQMKMELESTFPIRVHETDIQFNQDGDELQIAALLLTIEHSDATELQASTEERSNASDDQSKQETVRPVEPVIIEIDPVWEGDDHSSSGRNENIQMNAQKEKIQREVLTYLKDEWNITVDKIDLFWTRG